MNKLRLLIVIPALLLFLASPASKMTAMAVRVDILDNYDGNKVGQETDSDEERRMEQEEEDEENGVTSAASTASSAAATRASSAASTASTATAATSNATTAATTTPAASTTASTAAATASTTTNDLPQTGDDDRIFITMVIMVASFSVFLTALLGEKFGKNH